MTLYQPDSSNQSFMNTHTVVAAFITLLVFPLLFSMSLMVDSPTSKYFESTASVTPPFFDL